MAFCLLEDMNGTIDLTFFQKAWEKYSPVLKIDGVFGIKGKIDLSRDTPSFLVDEVLDPKDLQERSVKEIHIKLDSGMKTERDLMPLKNYLFEQSGNCSVYFHIERGGKKYLVMANQQLTVPSNNEFVEGIKDLAFVESVWKE